MGVKMQPSTGQWLARGIKVEEMARRINHRMALTIVRPTPRLTQNSPGEIKVTVPFVRGRGASQDQRLVLWLNNIRQYMSYKIKA